MPSLYSELLQERVEVDAGSDIWREWRPISRAHMELLDGDDRHGLHRGLIASNGDFDVRHRATESAREGGIDIRENWGNEIHLD